MPSFFEAEYSVYLPETGSSRVREAWHQVGQFAHCELSGTMHPSFTSRRNALRMAREEMERRKRRK